MSLDQNKSKPVNGKHASKDHNQTQKSSRTSGEQQTLVTGKPNEQPQSGGDSRTTAQSVSKRAQE